MERDRVNGAGMHEGFEALAELLGWSLERGLWFLRRVAWRIEDGAAALGTRGCIAVGGGTAFFLAAAGSALFLLAGAGSGPVAAPASPATASIEQPRLIFLGAAGQPSIARPETLHGAAPAFALSPAGRSSGGAAAGRATSAASPVAATISSDPKGPNSNARSGSAAAGEANATAARAVPPGPPAGPAALAVAREFAQGFVVYETGGEASGFEDAFGSTATPALRKALLARPPRQPAGVKVPRAKVLNVVAGPSRGSAYEVSVALLRVGASSELRLQMEKLKSAGKHAEWRVADVLG
jgi:hypothetical protein